MRRGCSSQEKRIASGAIHRSHPLHSSDPHLVVAQPAMENHKEKKNGWMSVPQFGGWDQKAGGATDYSMVFSRARANRKQNKADIKRASLGNEKEFEQKEEPVAAVKTPKFLKTNKSRKRSILRYFTCCVRPS